MSAERVADLYMLLDVDAELARLIAEDPELNDYERLLLMDAAGEAMPDVSGYALGPGEQVTVWAPYHFITTQYVLKNLANDAKQAEFSRFLNAAGINPDG